MGHNMVGAGLKPGVVVVMGKEVGVRHLSTQGHLHKLELEVVLEGVGSNEAQFARRDGAGEEDEEKGGEEGRGGGDGRK